MQIHIPFNADDARNAAGDRSIRRYAAMTPQEAQKVQVVIDGIFENISRLASRRGERLMVIDLHPEQNRLCGYYTRKQRGETITPEDALNATTWHFLKALTDAGFQLQQAYAGPLQALWSERGPQRLVISW